MKSQNDYINRIITIVNILNTYITLLHMTKSNSGLGQLRRSHKHSKNSIILSGCCCSHAINNNWICVQYAVFHVIMVSVIIRFIFVRFEKTGRNNWTPTIEYWVLLSIDQLSAMVLLKVITQRKFNCSQAMRMTKKMINFLFTFFLFQAISGALKNDDTVGRSNKRNRHY